MTKLPGFNTPAVGFEQPFEMLEACHERVQRSLTLLQKLLAHLDARGHDTASRSAAQDVLRYFDLAAPLHHEDEEINIFPVLLMQTSAAMQAVVHTLQQDHRRMSAVWAQLRPALHDWSLPTSAGAVAPAIRQAVQTFAGLYDKHISTEEKLVYPAARGHMDSAQIADAGRQMQARRRAQPSS